MRIGQLAKRTGVSIKALPLRAYPLLEWGSGETIVGLGLTLTPRHRPRSPRRILTGPPSFGPGLVDVIALAASSCVRSRQFQLHCSLFEDN